MKEEKSDGNRELHGNREQHGTPVPMQRIDRPRATLLAYTAEARKMIARGFEVLKVTRRHWPIKK